MIFKVQVFLLLLIDAEFWPIGVTFDQKSVVKQFKYNVTPGGGKNDLMSKPVQTIPIRIQLS